MPPARQLPNVAPGIESVYGCGGTGVVVEENRDRHDGVPAVVQAIRVHMPMAPGAVREQLLQPSNHVLH